MTRLTCPFCAATLDPSPIHPGCWECKPCDVTLGKAKPATVPSKTSPPTEAPETKPPLRPAWGWVATAVAFALVGSILGCMALWRDGTPSKSVSKRVQAMEDAFGANGAQGIICLVFLGMAAYGTVASVRSAGNSARIAVGSSVGLVVLGTFITGAILTNQRNSETGQQRALAAQLRSLPLPHQPSDAPPAIPLHDKILVWDCTRNKCSKVQDMLPTERFGQATDSPLTVILILDVFDRQTGVYRDGTIGYHRELVVAVYDWPGKKVLGVFKMEGELPGFFVKRDKREKGPIIGDTDGPLLKWISN